VFDVLGAACRLPGATNLDKFWRILRAGDCTVASAPKGRFSVARFLHGRKTEPGYSYTLAGGYIDNPFGFDAEAFGISAREAAQMDPQQRVLLEVVWEALEDAGIPPSRTAGEAVGVYVGASNVDYQNSVAADQSAIESHFVTGIALSIVSNRLSYVFDWKGPSMTIDTACSSSIVALAQALDDLAADKISMAVVAGVNMLLSPVPFVGFSRARMLSPTGLCRPFSADGDGYVRSEGAAALILRKSCESRASRGDERIRAQILGAGVNSDGRTVGVSLPSVDGQTSLLRSVYDRLEIAPDDLSFVEAHGTGTPVGDPVEAEAIGGALGQYRKAPLPIGSVKSNIGHLESASGVAGLVKTILSLQHRVYPRTLHLDQLNPNIPFDELRISPVSVDLELPENDEPLLAGVCNYGFGGTNAHAVIQSPPVHAPKRSSQGAQDATMVSENQTAMFTVSAHTKDALRSLVDSYADKIAANPGNAAAIVKAAQCQRDNMKERAAFSAQDEAQLIADLRRFGTGADDAAIASGRSQADVQCAFVFSGNGCQWAGMGKHALQNSGRFADQIADIDRYFEPLSGWAIREMLVHPEMADKLPETSIAQPLIYAIQSALNGILQDGGLVPNCIVGHSVGEVAAAEACGTLSRSQAVRLIFERSRHQELVRGKGGMVAVAAGTTIVQELINEAAPALTIAAMNGPSSTTISGSNDQLEAFMSLARAERLATLRLDIDYPFHSAFLDEEHAALLEALTFLDPRKASIPFVSATAGSILSGPEMGAEYWWQNIRMPVQFEQAISLAIGLGANTFVEISPRPILLNAIGDTGRQADINPLLVPTFNEETDADKTDPIATVLGRMLVHGVAQPSIVETVSRARDGGSGEGIPAEFWELPLYPWQHKDYLIEPSSEAISQMGGLRGQKRHPLLGTRMADGSPEWRMVLDDTIIPYLADHKVGSETVVPGAGLIEMALAAARELFGDVEIKIDDLDVFRALLIPEDGMREISVRFEESRSRIEIWSRPRFGDAWAMHAAGRVSPLLKDDADLGSPQGQERSGINNAHEFSHDEVYASAKTCGLIYGPSFRRVNKLVQVGNVLHADLSASSIETGAFDPGSHVVDPTAIDAAFHGLFIEASEESRNGAQNAFLPVRVGRIAVWQPHTHAAFAKVEIKRKTRTARIADALLLDQSGEAVAQLKDVYLRRVTLNRTDPNDRILRTDFTTLEALNDKADASPDASARIKDGTAAAEEAPDAAPWQLIRALALSATQHAVNHTFPTRQISTDDFESQSADVQARLGAALSLLVECGIAQIREDGWTVHFDEELPKPSVLLATMAERFPNAQADLVIAAQMVADWASLDNASRRTANPRLNSLFAGHGSLFAASRLQTARMLETLQAECVGRCPRVLIVDGWADGLERILAKPARAGLIELMLLRLDGELSPALKELADITANHRFIDASERAASKGLPDREAADALILGPVLGESERALEALSHAATYCSSTSRAAICDLARDPVLPFIVRGNVSAQDTLDPADVAAQAKLLLGEEGFQFAETDANSGLTSLTLAKRSGAQAGSEKPAFRVVPGDVHCAIDDALADVLRDFTDDEQGIFLDLPPGLKTDMASSFIAERRAMRIAGHLRLQSRRERPNPLWIMTRGAFGNGPHPSADADAIWRFGRVAMNEYPDIDIRLIDLAVDLPTEVAAHKLIDICSMPGDEKELLVDRQSVRAPRVMKGYVDCLAGISDETRARLNAVPGQSFDHFDWVIEERPRPGPDEIEIETAAIGLNFRDVMLGLGLLDEDILGHGLTSSALGFECVGRVQRVGTRVKQFAVGDLVMGFADDAFASHVTALGDQFFSVPADMTVEAAATIPVAFSTAWYSLKHVAHLQAGETLLVHGAAGGVGMAAIQIARLTGAKILATAGTDAKRALVDALGADAVYNSRDAAFADHIMRDHDGVDVVLNSLAGDQMWASFRTLKPFGRFVELGKRDFLENTPIDLRPFVRNRSYFGVDLDELLAHDKLKVSRIVDEISDAFQAGDLIPLPHRVFNGEDVPEAFRLMQRSGHLGKIVVRPAQSGLAPQEEAIFKPAPGVHLVLGGTRGFGFEAAMRLAERGAEKVVIASRSGVQDPDLKDRMAEFDDRIVVEQIDATEDGAVWQLCQKIRSELGPISGVVHTAMVLEDGFLDGITAESLGRVTRPKTRAVDALHDATIDDALQYFVVFSSATTVIGSPGQAAYVLANGYLEGVIEKRRSLGLPGLAVAWGAISDAGAIARNKELGERLERTTGVTGIQVYEALNHLESLLAKGSTARAIETYSAIGGSAVAERLAILSTPAFLNIKLGQADNVEGRTIDLHTLLREKSESEVFDALISITIEEISHILRIAPDTIDPNQSLAEIGMDSLMGLELRLSFENKFGIELPLLAIGDLSVASLTRKLITELSDDGEANSEEDVAESLLSIHGASGSGPDKIN
jgi:phthiocerol/phenolphthiocerol synthesis type-I polyketide synthase C